MKLTCALALALMVVLGHAARVTRLSSSIPTPDIEAGISTLRLN